MNYLRQVLLLTLFFLPALQVALAANASCSRKICSEDPAHGCFRGVDGDLLQFMRSNPAGSLACFREQLAPGDGALQRLSAFKGIIGGDVKPDNVDIVEDKGRLHIGLIDLDDGGSGSFLADFFHTLTYNHAWKPAAVRISFEAAVEAYRRGLSGQELTGVWSLHDILGDATPGAPACKDLRRQARDWRAPHAAGSRVSQQYETDRQALEAAIRQQKLGKVSAVGAKVKDSGGSMCLPRFLYLIEVDDKGKKRDQCRVVEFKALGNPAAAVFGDAQIDHAVRIRRLLEYYRPSGSPGALIDVIRAPRADYIERWSVEARFDGGSKPKNAQDIKRHQAFALHMLYWLGSAHARQDKAYAESFQRDFPALQDKFEGLLQAHVADLKRVFGLAKPGCF